MHFEMKIFAEKGFDFVEWNLVIQSYTKGGN